MLMSTDVNKHIFELKIRCEEKEFENEHLIKTKYKEVIPHVIYWETANKSFISINNKNSIEIIKLPKKFKAFNLSKLHCSHCGRKNLVNFYYFNKTTPETVKSAIKCTSNDCNIVYALFIENGRGEFRSIYKDLNLKAIKLNRRFDNL